MLRKIAESGEKVSDGKSWYVILALAEDKDLNHEGHKGPRSKKERLCVLSRSSCFQVC